MPPRIDAKAADAGPTGPTLTKYDEELAITYVRMLDADKAGAYWREVARIVLGIDAGSEPDRARLAFDTHLARAKWMAHTGYRLLLKAGTWQR